MGVLWFVLGLVVVVVGVGVTVMVTYVRRSSSMGNRDRLYRRRMAEIENKKARAELDKDAFGMWSADQEAIALRDRYIAGKDV